MVHDRKNGTEVRGEGGPSGNPDVTIIMTMNSRIRYFEQYVQEGLVDGLPLLLVDDGLSRESSLQLQATAGRYGISVIRPEAPGGAARAIRSGISGAPASHVMLVEESDYLLGFEAFTAEALRGGGEQEGVLFSAVPTVFSFNEVCQAQRTSDRRAYDGMTGHALLAHLIEAGEAQDLVTGGLFDKAMVAGLLPPPWFEHEAHLLLLARLCGRYPGHVVRVPGRGRYMRLRREHPHSTGPAYSLERAVMHLVAISVGGNYLVAQGEMDRGALVEALHRRGYGLQETHGLGAQAAAVIGALVAGRPYEAFTREAHRTLGILKHRLAGMPLEFLNLIGERGRHLRQGASRQPLLVSVPAGRRAEGRVGGAAPAARYVVGGGPCSGTSLVQMLLCQAEDTCGAIPPSYYLRSLLQVFRRNTAGPGVMAQAPVYFDDAHDFGEYHRGVVQGYLERLHRRVASTRRLVLCDTALTPYFPELYALHPEARLICMVRDPRDAIASMLDQAVSASGGLPMDLVNRAAQERDISRLCQYYRSFYTPLLACTDRRFRENMLLVHYEDLIERTEAGVRRLEAFTRLDLTPWMADKPPVPRRGSEHPYGLRRVAGGAIPPASLQRVGIHTNVLTLEETRRVEAECVDLFEVFGYSRHLRAAA